MVLFYLNMNSLSDSFPNGTFLGLDITFHPFTVGLFLVVVIIALLLFISGLMSGAEASYFSLSLSDRNKLNKRNGKSAKAALGLLSRPEYLLSTILFVNNMVNVSVVILSTYLTNSLVNFANEPIAGFVFQIVIITFVLLLLGEIMPKIVATYHPVRFVLFMAIPLTVLNRIFRPVSHVLITSTSFINKRIAKKVRHNISMDDLSEAIEITGTKTQENRRILKGIVDFVNTEANEIMTPRLDVAGIEISEDFNALKRKVLDSGYSRLLAYDETLDNVKGVLYIKDLLPFLEKSADFGWLSLVRTPYFVPENKKINDLLEEFQQKKIHLAVVVDEYGGTCGVVTLEDILEEIVGEISDESDFDEEQYYSKLDDHTYLFEGKTLLNDFVKILGIADELIEEVRGDAETLAGLLLEMKGDFLQRGEELMLGQYTFKVDQLDKRRIKKIRVSITVENDENEAE